MVVQDVMTSTPVTAEPTWTVREVLDTLYEHDFRHIPVTSGSELLGMISDRDLREQIMVPVMMRYESPGEADSLLDQPASEVMRGDVLSVHPETELAEAIDLMLEHKVGALPVIEPGTAELVGIVSYVDILRGARDLV